MLSRFICVLFLLWPAILLAGAKPVEEPLNDKQIIDEVSAEPSVYFDRFRASLLGLQLPLFEENGIDPPICEPRKPGRTLGLFIAAGQSLELEQFWLPGPKNDVELFRNALTLRGAELSNLHVLTGKDATRTKIAAAAKAMLSKASCNDSIILHFSGWALPYTSIGLPDDETGPFGASKKEYFLDQLLTEDPVTEANAELQTLIEHAGPYALVNYEKPGRGEVLSAGTISELVTRFRNRGAHVSIILDGPSAIEFAIERRQERAEVTRYNRTLLPGPENKNDDACNSACAFEKMTTNLQPNAGELTVFYGTEYGNPGLERRLPPDSKSAKQYGFLSYQLATAISTAERTTIGALSRYINADVSTEIRAQDYTFITTDPDLDLIAEDRPQNLFQAPQILIDSPQLTRSALKLRKPVIEIQGRIEGMGSPIQVKINDQIAQIEAPNNFLARYKLNTGVNAISVHAITDANESLRYDFELYYEGDIRAVIGQGKRYALIIANQDYDDGSGIPDLKTPIGDARALENKLVNDYGFTTEATMPDGAKINLFLENANLRDIALTLGPLARLAGPRDSVLIFYAGHGEYDTATNAAYWLPTDAVQSFPATFFDAKTLNDTLQTMQAGNVLIISDSCYSGMLLRSSGEEGPTAPDKDRLQQLQRLSQSRSRVVMSSGGNTPVLDGGGNGHSVFARALFAALDNPHDSAFSARELHQRIHADVSQRSNFNQEPDFRSIYGAGHDGGDFVFLKKE